MIGILLNKCYREGRWLFACIAAIMGSFCWLRVWMVSRIDAARFEGIIDLLPTEWQKFSPVDIQFLITYTGRMAAAYSEPLVVFGVAAWAISRASDVISGELSRGTMEMLLAQPLSRWRVLWTHSLVTTVGTILLASTAWVSTTVGIHTLQIREEYRPTIPLPLPAAMSRTQV